MLPPGHIAGGYLTAEFLLRTFHFNISNHQRHLLEFVGIFFGFAPDLDFFLAFYKARQLKIDHRKANHRKYFTHAPVLWMIAGIIIYLSAATDFYRALGLIVWLSSWSHFILDSEWGIMWAWPFSKRLYPFSKMYYQNKYSAAVADQTEEEMQQGFWKYWKNVVFSFYSKPSGWIEILIIIIAIYVATTSYR